MQLKLCFVEFFELFPLLRNESHIYAVVQRVYIPTFMLASLKHMNLRFCDALSFSTNPRTLSRVGCTDTLLTSLRSSTQVFYSVRMTAV